MATLLGITDIAKRLGKDRSTVFRWVQLGKLEPVHKMDNATGPYLFEPAEVDRFIATLSEVPEDGAA